MSFRARGSTLAAATKRFVARHPGLRWYYVAFAVGFATVLAGVVLTYPAEAVFVAAARIAAPAPGRVTAFSFVVGVGAVLYGGLAATVVVAALASGLVTAAVTGHVRALATANSPDETTLARAAFRGVWRALRALPVLALLFGVLGPLVVCTDRRTEHASRRRGFLGSLAGASLGTYAHLAVPAAATTGGSARRALRESRALIVDAYGDDALATPGIFPAVGATWIVPALVLAFAAFAVATLLAGGRNPSDATTFAIGIPLFALVFVGIVRAVVLQSVFRAALHRELATPDDDRFDHDAPPDDLDAPVDERSRTYLGTVDDTVTRSYRPDTD